MSKILKTSRSPLTREERDQRYAEEVIKAFLPKAPNDKIVKHWIYKVPGSFD
jgi:hypothetical protein